MEVRKWGGEALFVAPLGGQGGRSVQGLKGGKRGRGNRAVFLVSGVFMGPSHGRPAFRGSAGYPGGS